MTHSPNRAAHALADAGTAKRPSAGGNAVCPLPYCGSMLLTDITPAIALSPLDGRYQAQTAPLVEYLSEPALNRERIHVETEWMIYLAGGDDGKTP